MGKLMTAFMTLNGVGQAGGGPDEDRDGDFAHGGWMAPVADQGSGEVVFEEASSIDALLLGRKDLRDPRREPCRKRTRRGLALDAPTDSDIGTGGGALRWARHGAARPWRRR
jgi:hypothetical protein